MFTAQLAALDEAAGILRRLRDFLIEKFGIEDADRAVPAWRIDWMTEPDSNPGFADPAIPTHTNHEDTSMVAEDAAAFADALVGEGRLGLPRYTE